jgi:CHAT domain-containing protein
MAAIRGDSVKLFGRGDAAVFRSRTRRLGVTVLQGWLLSALVAVAVLVAVSWPPRDTSFTEPTIASLVAAAPPNARGVEARLSGGFAWAPFRVGAATPSQTLHLASAIEFTAAQARGMSTATARHTLGIAELLDGRPRDALASLLNAAKATNAPGAWSDLAAAYYETALRQAAPELLADALAAVDRALDLDPKFPEALFNRALIVEKLGLRDDARGAWEQYLANDSTTAWATEAREHTGRLPVYVPFLELVDRDQGRLTGDPAAVLALARSDPQEARQRTEMEILGSWGRARQAGDEVGAMRWLSLARELGRAIARINHDLMVERAVAAIEAAAQPASDILASAHADYDAGLKAFQAQRPTDAEALLLRAASGFARTASPMELSARYFAANTAFEQGRDAEAQGKLEALLAAAPPGVDAYRTQLMWQIGVCHVAAARWGDSIRFLTQSAESFERLGEVGNAAQVRRVLALAYDRTGDPDAAWKHRTSALSGIGGRSGTGLEKAVASIAHDAILRGRWDIAASFVDLELEIARRIGDDVHLAEALLIRAVVRERLKDRAGARADAADAALTIAKLQDPAYRSFLQADHMSVVARLAPTPEEASALTTAAIEFVMAKGDRMKLPSLLLQRARALRQTGRLDGARLDLDRGIAALEASRESLPRGDARWGAFCGDEELFEEAIDLAVQEEDPGRALDVAEKARARVLLETYGRAPTVDYRALPRDAVVVEYVSLPSRTIILTADVSGVRATVTPWTRDALAADVERLVRAFSHDETETARRTSALLYRRLVQPVAGHLLGAKTLVLVPDATLAPVPFSALVDPAGGYLLEKHVIVVAPSAAVFAAAAQRGRNAVAPRSVLVVASSGSGEDAGALAFVDMEANAVARAYPHAVRLAEDGAQFEELGKDAAGADVIHFAGHGVGDDSGLEPASILLRERGKERRVAVSEIAGLRLTRTSTVVLAGCSTARGERRSSEGVISVAHGFLIAGAPSVIATLWPIDDAGSAALFPQLHARLAEGLEPAAALRAVQLEAIARGTVPASLWAALQTMGN